MEMQQYYKYRFEDEQTDSKYRILIKREEILLRNNRIQFVEMTEDKLDSKTLDHIFLDTLTHHSLLETDDYLEYHLNNFDGDKNDFIYHTDKIIRRGKSLMELEAEEWKEKDSAKDFRREGDNPQKYLKYLCAAQDWIEEYKREHKINAEKNQGEFLKISKILRNYPKALQCYLNAIDKLDNENYTRNLLDDLRLTLELYISSKLKNSKSLENQIEAVGIYCKEKGVSKEVANMFHKLIDLYTKYQNNYIKHDYAVNKGEILFILNLTNNFIEFIEEK
jgi:hypothetical protein